MMSYPVKRTWIFSKTAGQFYFVAALLGYGYFIFLFAIAFSAAFFRSVPQGHLAIEAFRFLSWIGAIGLGTIWISMLLCVVRFDRESLAGGIYLVVLMVFGPLGALVYYGLRYRGLLRRDLEAVGAAAASV